MRIELFSQTLLMLCEIRRAFDVIKMKDCYYYNSLRQTLCQLISSYYDGLGTQFEPHVFYMWADHLVEISLAFANESLSDDKGTYELYASWCLGIAESIYDSFPVPEIAEAGLAFAKMLKSDGYVETDMFTDWH